MRDKRITSHSNNNILEFTVLMTKNSTNANRGKSYFKRNTAEVRGTKVQSKKGTMECTHYYGTNHTKKGVITSLDFHQGISLPKILL